MRRRWSRAAFRWVRSAPLTYCWLAVLLVTTVAQRFGDEHEVNALLRAGSTNLHHLAVDPLRVLVSSLVWIDGRYWTPYLLAFTVVLAPAERWLGPLRWLAVGLVAHVGATYLSEGWVHWLVEHAQAPPRLVDVRDVGVSYFLVGVAGVLAYRIRRPWRWVYVGATVAGFTAAFALEPRFTPLGHLGALLIGLAMFPLARPRVRAAYTRTP